MTRPKLPIGYWLKQADNLLTEQINRAQAANGVSRFDWQVLNLLYESGGAGKERLFEHMQTFVAAADFEAIIAHLKEQRWVEQSQNSSAALQLTETGQQQHKAILTQQKAIRERAMQGISTEEYGIAISVLQRIVNNLSENSPNLS